MTLCEVSEVGSEELANDFDQAEYGIEFVVVIIKKTEEAGKCGLKELRDFKIDGANFVEKSARKIEPKTNVDAVEKYAKQLVN